MNLRNGLFFALTLGIVTTGACGGSTEPTPSPSPVVLALRAIVASTDLAPGENRFVFALLNERSAPIRSSGARVSLSYLQGDTRVSHTEVEALFRSWPVGPGGVFTAQVDFSQPGTWFAEIFPKDGEAAGEVARLAFEVKEQSSTPALGSPAPKSRSRIAADVAALEEITTDPEPDPELYALTIAQALETGLPLMVTFATPAFCTSATCGPQVDVVKALKETYKGRVNFIHVEIYDNPQEMREDLQKARVSPVIDEWGLPSEPWTFLVDAEGRVAAKFEAFTSAEELEEALLKTLGS